MGIGTVAGRTVNFLESALLRVGRLNPWVTAGMAGAVVAGALYKNRRDERRIAEAVRETFRDEIRERDLWQEVRSQVAGASQDLYRTFHVYRKGDAQPILQRAHDLKPGEGGFVVPVDEPDVAEALDLVGRALENLARSRVDGLAPVRESGRKVSREAVTVLKRVKARLARVAAGQVKRPDIPGMQKNLDGLLEEKIKPVIGDLCHAIDQGTLRIRAEIRKGAHGDRAG